MTGRPEVCPYDGLRCDGDCPENDPCHAPGASLARAMLTEPDRSAGLRAELVTRAAEEAERIRPRPPTQEALFSRAPLRWCATCATSMHTRHPTCPSCGGAWDVAP